MELEDGYEAGQIRVRRSLIAVGFMLNFTLERIVTKYE